MTRYLSFLAVFALLAGCSSFENDTDPVQLGRLRLPNPVLVASR
jgi:hypothetical protein